MNHSDSNEESIFHQALEFTSEEDRRLYLEQACGEDMELKHSIESLLAAYKSAGQETDFLEPTQFNTANDQDIDLESNLNELNYVDRYRLIKLIGAGGFGEVYLAEQKEPVSRNVALKILKQGPKDEQVKARFDSERQALADMDHPNIANVLDGGNTQDGRPYFVMDFIDGESITAYCSRKHLRTPAILELFSTICQAMQHAHDNGVIHRDLKPSNILITRKDGSDVVRLIDFGIAKAKVEPWNPAPAKTQQNQLLGTPAYMSPEQARGEILDHRTDIWSIGVVLFECLAGKAAFQEISSMDVLGAIMHQSPDWDALPDEIPDSLLRLLEDCLQKDRKKRIGSLLQVRLNIQNIVEETGSGASTLKTTPFVSPSTENKIRNKDLTQTMVGAILGALVVLIVYFLQTPVPTPPENKIPMPPPALRTFQISLPMHSSLSALSPPKISPDGRRIVFTNQEGIWVRDLSSLKPSKLKGTLRAIKPFWSPDSADLGFVDSGSLRWLNLDTSESYLLGNIPGFFEGLSGSAVWTDSDIVLYSMLSSYTGVNAVSVSSGEQALIHLPDWHDKEYDYDDLSPLPGGEGILCVIHGTNGPDKISLLRPEPAQDGTMNLVISPLLHEPGESLGSPVFSSSGHVLFHKRVKHQGVWAFPFSSSLGKRTGEPFRVIENAFFPSISEEDTLICVNTTKSITQKLSQISRDGTVIKNLGQPLENMAEPRISPDGKHLVVSASTGGQIPKDIWLLRQQWEPLTSSAEWEWSPVWHQDSNHLYFKRDTSGRLNARIMELNISNLKERELWSSDAHSWLTCFFHPTPGHLFLTVFNPAMKQDIWELNTRAKNILRPYIESQDNQLEVAASPDGRCIAYLSEQGTEGFALILKPLEEGTIRTIPQANAIRNIRWRADGSELFYLDGSMLKSMHIHWEPNFQYDPPSTLLDFWKHGYEHWRGFDVAPDGESFYVLSHSENSASHTEIIVTENWTHLIPEMETENNIEPME